MNRWHNFIKTFVFKRTSFVVRACEKALHNFHDKPEKNDQTVNLVSFASAKDL